jgi:hypothetical protein
MRVWVAGTGGVKQPGEEHLTDQQVALQYANEHLERHHEFRREVMPPDEHEVAFDEALDSLRPGKLIYSQVVHHILLNNVKPGFFIVNTAVAEHWLLQGDRRAGAAPPTPADLPEAARILWPLCYANHWILAVLHKPTKQFDVYDSLRGYAHGPRTAVLQRVQKVFRDVHNTWLNFTLRATDQQAEGSNDCAVHTVSNAFFIMGITTLVTRKWMREQWIRAAPAREEPARKKNRSEQTTASQGKSRMSEAESLRAMLRRT